MNIKDSNKIKNKLIKSDLTIIGAGIAGIFLAYLLRNKNIKITLIEKGNTDQKKKESLYINKKIFHYGGYKEEGIKLGGKGNVWGGQLVEFTKKDLSKNFWGVSYEELKKLYKEVYNILKINISENPNNVDKKLVYEKYKIKRYFTYFLKNPNLYNFFYKELINNKNIEIYKNLSVYKIKFKGNIAKSLDCLNSKNQIVKIFSKKFIFSMGTLENNRFFLNNKKIKKNPLKKNKNIGKFFQDHLGIVVGQLKIESKEKFRKYFENGVFKKNNYQPKLKCVDDNIPIGISAEFHCKSIHDKKILLLKKYFKNFLINYDFIPFFKLLFDRVTFKIFIESFLHLVFQKRIKSYFDRQVDIYIQAEQIPIKRSFLKLSKLNSKDKLKKLDIHWNINFKEVGYIKKFSKNLSKFLIQKKIGKIIFNKNLNSNKDFIRNLRDTNHASGGLCIGKTHNSVCDLNMRLRPTKNIYITGSSLFPNSSYANVGLTILAMTLKLAKILKK